MNNMKVSWLVIINSMNLYCWKCRVMSRILLGAMDEKRLELIVDRELMQMVTNIN